MASFKESTSARPQPLARPTTASASNPVNVPIRNGGPLSSRPHSHSHSHSHSTSLGVLNQMHRVNRRKSVSNNNANNLSAVLQGMEPSSLDALVASSDKTVTGTMSRSKRSDSMAGQKPETTYLTPNYQGPRSWITRPEDGLHAEKNRLGLSTNNKARRASEGSFLPKTEGGRRLASGELKCDQCGKEYKHSSCLTKHLWEHTPEWGLTSKLLISKHQQVQLLEAASVLLVLNKDQASTDSEMDIDNDIKPNENETDSSASPTASGSSEAIDDSYSSTEPSPPPVDSSDEMGMAEEPFKHNSKRDSSTSSVFSRSYQSQTLGTSIPSYSNHRAFLSQRRPSSPGSASRPYPYSLHPDDEAGLAAAVDLVHFGTPRTGPLVLDDIPPVPPLPARYANANTLSKSMGAFSPPLPMSLGARISDERGSMAVKRPSVVEDEKTKHGHAEDDEDGVFGKMEE